MCNQQLITNDSEEKNKSFKISLSLKNILILSFSFFLLGTSSNTGGAIQKVVVNSVNKQKNVYWDAYLSSCIVFAVYSVSNFLVPVILTLISTKTCIFLAYLGHVVYPLAFFYPFKYGLIIASIIVGVSAGVLWPTANIFISENSTEKTIDRNAGIFWSCLQSSLIVGNIYIFIQFNGVTEITEQKRIQIYSLFLAISSISAICFLFLKKPKQNTVQNKGNESSTSKIKISPITSLKNCFYLFKTKKMVFLCIASYYTGVEQSFYTAIYANTVGFTSSFGVDAKKYIGLYGIFTGVGAVFGGIIIMSGLLKKIKYIEKNRYLIYTLGFLGQIIAFSLAILNHPNRAPIEETSGKGFIEPKVYICLIIGFLLCLGDGLFNQMIVAFISTNYVDESENTSAFTLYKFFHCLGASISFLYASFDLTLIIHLIILLVFGTSGTVSFFLAEKIR